MKIESLLFEILTAFFFVCAVVYAAITGETVGVVALFLVTGMSLIIGTYFRFVARRLELRPEDNEDAEVADGAGDVGFFSPGSYWPFGVAAAAALMGVALAFFQVWLIVIAAVVLLGMVAGLVFEYHVAPADH